MKPLPGYVALLLVGCALCSASHTELPVYFIAGDAAASGCQVFSSPGSPQIASDGLEFPNGQRIHFLHARSGSTCTGAETENRLSIFTGQDPSKWRRHLPISRRIRFRSVY